MEFKKKLRTRLYIAVSYILLGLVLIAADVLNLLGYHDQALPFAWYVCGMVCLYWLSWFVIQKKY